MKPREVRDMRLFLGLTQEQLGKEVGYHGGAPISNIELGIHPPGYEKLVAIKKIAKKLGGAWRFPLEIKAGHIRVLRDRLDMTQGQFARQFDLSDQSMVSSIENGGANQLSQKVKDRLLDAFYQEMHQGSPPIKSTPPPEPNQNDDLDKMMEVVLDIARGEDTMVCMLRAAKVAGWDYDKLIDHLP